MSVPLHKRSGPTQFNVVTKAQDLFKYTRAMIKNDKHFPKKERYFIVKDIYELCRDLMCSLMEANELKLNIDTERNIRYESQKKAIISARKMLYLIRQSYYEKYISISTYEYWSKLVVEIIVLIQAWIKSDSRR